MECKIWTQWHFWLWFPLVFVTKITPSFCLGTSEIPFCSSSISRSLRPVVNNYSVFFRIKAAQVLCLVGVESLGGNTRKPQSNHKISPISDKEIIFLNVNAIPEDVWQDIQFCLFNIAWQVYFVDFFFFNEKWLSISKFPFQKMKKPYSVTFFGWSKNFFTNSA